MKNTSYLSAGPILSSVALAALLAVHAPSAQALSLGRLTVQSALGEALRAEIDISSITPEEADTLRAALASADAYRAAGVDFNGALQGAQVALVKRPDGRQVLRVTGDRSVSEPFLDVILDLNWNAGRLQRSYTLLIDPPVRAAPAPAPVTTTAAPVLSAAPATPPVAAPAAPRPAARAPSPPPAPAAAPVPPPAPAADGYRVKSGDTLSSIASANARPGVSLDQMLVALYRGNPQAFLGNNMNRLKSGVVLDVAQAQAAAKDITAGEARQVIQAQSADFGAFRQRLAGAAPTVKSAEPPRQSQGKVEAAVQDRKAPAAPTPDQLKLTKGAAKAASAPEAKISKDTERKAAEARVAELTRNVEELKRLSAGTGAAPAVQASGPAPSKLAAASVPSVGAAQVAPPAPAVPASAAAPAVPVPASASVAASAPSAVTAAVASMPASAASAPRPAASRPPVAAAPAPVVAEEPGLLEQLTVPLGVALVALLGGWGFMRLRRRGQEGGGETSFIESKLQPDSFFGVSGGQRVDTRDGPNSAAASSSLSYSLSQLDAIGDVDPVAEADVYLAYGRDLQAEEILKEALRSDGQRPAIRTKLLEVYAKRADVRAFNQQAEQLHQLTGGEGDDWARAAELGRQIDPANPLYALAEPALDQDVAPATVEPDEADPVGLSAPAEAPAPVDHSLPPLDISPAAAAPAGPPSSYDLDIDLDAPSDLMGLENTRPMTGTGLPPDLAPSAPGLLDDDVPPTQPSAFDALSLEPLGTEAAAAEPVSAEPGALDMPSLDLPPLDAPAPDKAASLDELSLDLPEDESLDLPELPDVTPLPAAEVSAAPADFDFGDLTLDLAAPEPSPPPPASGDDLDAGAADPLQRKIELADEFRRIGDVEGARDLLQEVVEQAEGSLKARAQALLDEL